MVHRELAAADGPGARCAFGNMHVVGVGVEAARVLSDRVDALDHVPLRVKRLEELVDARAACGGVGSEAALDRIEGTGLHFTEPLGILVEVLILADLHELVHAVRGGGKARGIHAGHPGKGFKRIGLVAEAVLDAALEEGVKVRELRPRRHHAEVAAGEPFLDHLLARLVVEDGKAFAAHFLKGVRDVFRRQRFIRNAFALKRGLEVGLEKRCEEPHVFGLRNAVLPELEVRRHALQPQARLHADIHVDELRARAFKHLHAVARATRRPGALVARIGKVLLHHLLVAGEPARGDDGVVGADRKGVAVLRNCLHALHDAVLNDEGLRRGGGHDLAALGLDAG